MSNKRAKTSGRTKTPAREKKLAFHLRIIESVGDHLVILEGIRRHPRIAVSQGEEGIRRVLKDEERRRAVSYLRQQRRRGYVEQRLIGGRIALVLTEKGEIMRLKLRIRASPKRTDGKRLIVVFDIPERMAQVRRALRQFLRSAGFTRLQHSVWSLERQGEFELTALLQRTDASKWVRCFLCEEVGE